MTRWGMIAGTPQYMSPEQARGESLDGRSDLFSLGCVLYEMATGVAPFKADSTIATLRRLVEERPQPLASLCPEVPRWFVLIVERLLEKEPARRFESAAQVSELLAGCLAHVQQRRASCCRRRLGCWSETTAVRSRCRRALVRDAIGSRGSSSRSC